VGEEDVEYIKVSNGRSNVCSHSI